MDYKIAIIGQEEQVLGFKGLGLDVIPTKNAEEAEEKLLFLKKQDPQEHAIIFVIEDIFQNISEDGMKKISSGALPAVIPIPGHKGSTGFGDARMRKFVEKAVGSDIFAN